MNKVHNLYYQGLAAVSVTVLSATQALADNGTTTDKLTFGGAAGTISGQMDNIKKLGVALIFAAGVFILLIGFIKFYKAANSQGRDAGYGTALALCLIGAAMMVAPATTGMLTESLGLGSAEFDSDTKF
ncbi:hypothetical protein [Flexibacterium corallicola]|uniref:hypothetical protein n=1 Tax=Flexibacterium corallicola TaxID=3037259 RepID=UPI00286F1A3B|nr:hypothetical protein [Pseudovibrio sp. M1P-2-3]